MIPITVTDVRAVPGDSAFLIDDGKTAVLYDTGFAFSGHKVAQNIRQVLGKRALNYILLTHSHYDHALGTPYIVKAFPAAKVVASEYAAKIFQKASARAVMRELNGLAAKMEGWPFQQDPIDELKADITVNDGDTVSCGDMHFTVVALPGHTKCSVGYYLAENKMLLSTETLGVFFPEDTYLPSFLVGYQMTMDAFQKVKKLQIERALLPHYGVVEKDRVQVYLANGEKVTREAKETIAQMLLEGKSQSEILAFLTERDYKVNVARTYPYDAYCLNTKIMIAQVEKECMMHTER